jgi:galactose mutarotase-like enzyme
MNIENPIENNALKIETIITPEGGEVSVCPERGGIITSIKFQDREILYLDQATLQDTNVNVKGGIPILFPNAGPLPPENPQYPILKQHGFARNSSKWRLERTSRGFKETLISDMDTNAVFPYNFRFSLMANFEEDGSFSINGEVENTGEIELPLAMGLHPYFKVPQDEKGQIKFNFEGGKSVEEQVELWANGKSISIDNPRVKDPDAIIEVVIPSLGTLIIDVSPEYKKIWIWSIAGKDFICIEPVMRNAGGLIENPENIPPKETLHTRVSFKLKE